MSKWVGCLCGSSQSDVAFPTPNKIHIITDEDLDGVTNYGYEPVTINADLFDTRKRTAFFCWDCGRLLIFENDKVRIFEEVTEPDDGGK